MNRATLSVLLLASVVTASCSGIQFPGDTWHQVHSIDPPELVPIVDFQWYEDHCGSTNTKWYIRNPSSKRWNVQVSEVQVSEADPNGSPTRITRTYLAQPNTGTFEKALFIGIEQVGAECFDRDFIAGARWPVDSANAMEYAAAKAQLKLQKRMQVRSSPASAKFQAAPPVPVDPMSLDCERECKLGTINCLRNTPPTAQVERVYQHLSTLPSSAAMLDKAAFLNVLQQATDACSRSDLILQKGRLYNSGESCALTFRAAASETQPSVALLLSGALKANYSASVSTYRLGFSDQSGMPVLSFANPALDADWGGEVLDMTSTKDGVYYHTAAGCVSLEKRP